MTAFIPRDPRLPPGLQPRRRPIPGKGRLPVKPPKLKWPTPKPPVPVKPPPPSSLDFTVTPDYAALLQANPDYQNLLSQTQAGVAQAASQRAAALRNLMQQYGGGLAGDTYGDLRDIDRELAEQNPFSVLKQLAEGFKTGQSQMRKGLAARGALRSGELGYSQGQLERERGQAEYDAAQQFMQAMAEAIEGYRGVESGFFQRESDVIRDISRDIALNNPVTKGKAAYNAVLSKQYGQPIYKDESGQLWVPSPNGAIRWTPPAPAPGYKLPTPVGPTDPRWIPPGLQPAPPGAIQWP